jgi:hypothetical protein
LNIRSNFETRSTQAYLQIIHPFSREINHAAGKQVPGDVDNEVSTAALYVKFTNVFQLIP